MNSDNIRERKDPRRYTFIVVPDEKSEKTRSVSLSRWGIVVGIVSTFIVMAALVVAVIIYTPVGLHLPISNPDVVKQYGKQISEIENQLQGLLREVTVLRNYNIMLRRAMGEHVSVKDSLPMASLDSIIHREDNRALEVEAHSLASDSVRILQHDQPENGEQIPERNLPLPFSLPTDGYISRTFDSSQGHFGIDFAGKPGTSVLASADGKVVFSGWTYETGFTIMIAHDLGFVTIYKHNQSLVKSFGQMVRRGETIALLGNTGVTSAGPHLHFEIWKNGIAENPARFLLTL